MRPLRFRVLAAIPSFNALPGDFLVVRPNEDQPVVLFREVPPEYETVLECLADEQIEPINFSRDEAAAIVSPPTGQPACRVLTFPSLPRERV